jgi:protein O-mannosyl-transferase
VNRRIATIAAALVVITLAAYSGVFSNSFVNYDDDVYVTNNPHVLQGLTAGSARWALTSVAAANWHPATWWSHMLDVSLFGVSARGHHATSLLLHVTNAVLLFLLLIRLTGAVWRSALVAALFAVHPLHVESVAWVAERKDVLSTCFWLLTVFAWLRWLESKTAGRYALVVLSFGLGLMAKPMLVTLPLTLMLLDFWPLKRASLPPLWKEKLPLLAMSAGSSVITFVAQRSGGTVLTLAGLSIPARIANAAEAYVTYLGKAVWPASLACFYPHTGVVHVAPALGSALLLAAITALALRLKTTAPYFAFGWAWYLGTLVPVIGLVQVGMQSSADRYTYVPLVGVFVAIAWGLGDLAAARPGARPAIAAIAAASCVVLIPVTRADVRHWRDNTSLFTHALAVTTGNALAHNNLGLAFFGRGDIEGAIVHYREAVRIRPDYGDAHDNLGAALHALGRDGEAADQLAQALAIDPKSAPAQVNFGNTLVARDRPEEAIEHYRQALRLQPDFADAHQNLGLVLEALGRHEEAIPHFERAVRSHPHDAPTLLGFANALAGVGRVDEAMTQYEAALTEKPDLPEAYDGMGVALAARGRNAEAIERYEHALRLKPEFAEALNNLGLALAATGRLPDAIARFEHAIKVKPDFAQAHNNLGVSFAQTHRTDEAIEQFRLAVQFDPGLDQARANLATLEGARH